MGLLGGPVVKTLACLVLPLQGTQVWFLVQKLRSCMPCSIFFKEENKQQQHWKEEHVVEAASLLDWGVV